MDADDPGGKIDLIEKCLLNIGSCELNGVLGDVADVRQILHVFADLCEDLGFQFVLW